MHDGFKSYSDLNDNKSVFYTLNFFESLITPIYKRNCNFGSEVVKIAAQNLCLVLVKICSGILLCRLGELAGGGSVDVAVVYPVCRIFFLVNTFFSIVFIYKPFLRDLLRGRFYKGERVTTRRVCYQPAYLVLFIHYNFGSQP